MTDLPCGLKTLKIIKVCSGSFDTNTRVREDSIEAL